ncbi:Photosystem II protein, chloroplastic [Sesamum angolense]|uniref:Photosystem II protein, chloroplastic n=1 Tax=Sesamum angolense TaxID=2727404 RepID=A0AAE1WA90_9LAMI|nr:Photosystem II protein, chloroplastic [Sesamum angolense]
MAQTMLLTANVSGHVKGEQLLIHTLKPKPFSHFLLPPGTRTKSSSHLPSSTTVALFKSKTKAPPAKKVVEKPKVEDGIFGTSGGIGLPSRMSSLWVVLP